MRIFLYILFILAGVDAIGQNPATGGNLLMKSNGSVSIGTEVNTSPLTIANFSTPFITPQSGTLLHLVSNGVTNGRVSFDTYNDASVVGSIFQGRRARGTASSPTPPIADDILVAIGGDGYGDDAFHNVSMGGLTLRSLQTMTNADAPTYLSFYTVPSGSATQAERVRILSDGTFRITGLNSIGILQTDADGDFTTKSYSDTKADLGLNNVTNESKATMFTSPTFTGNPVLATPASGNFTSGSFNWPTFNQNTTGSAAALTTTRTIWGQNFNGTANVTGDITLSTSSITMTGSIATTGSRVTKIWATDGEFTNMPTVGGTSLSSTFSPIAGSASILTVGTIGTGTWQGGVISSTYGGTGVNNGGRTLTLNTNSGTIAFSGASKTLTIANTITLTATDGSTLAIGAGGTLGSNAYTSTSYQPLATNLTSIGALANASGYLKNNGSGTFTYETPAGAGTVTNTGNLTSNSVVLGNGTTDTKVVAGITTDGTSQLNLGVNATTIGKVKMFGNTSGDATIQPAAVAGTATVITLPIVSGTLMLNTATSGVAASPTANGTTTVTHSLGRIPTIIRIYGLGGFTNNNSAVPQTQSTGLWTSSGNTCLYQRYNATAVTTAQAVETSTSFAIFIGTSNGNFISGVIQNVTSTGFDIVWTETGTAVAQAYLWEAQ